MRENDARGINERRAEKSAGGDPQDGRARKGKDQRHLPQRESDMGSDAEDQQRSAFWVLEEGEGK